jgi:hypothetical protein
MRKTGLRTAGAFALAAVFGMSGIVAAQKPGKQKPRQVPETGVERVPTPADVAGEALLEQMTSRSTAGLVPVVSADGTISLDLEGRFMNVMLAVPGTGGELTLACETGPEALKRGKAAASQHQTGKANQTAAPIPTASGTRELK